ncbi:Site-specific recombinase XerD [Lachnospiraceae bacterium XBB1006]|nr:Site-specific recombinase XerD [Lachnospiraceae bacterium XBB1006]
MNNNVLIQAEVSSSVPELMELNEYGNIDNIESLELLLQRKKDEMRKKQILSQYEIKQFQTGANAGKYYVKIDGKKHQSNTREGLEAIILEHCSGVMPKNKTTFKALFDASQEDRLKRIKDPAKRISAEETIKVHRRDYRRYFAETSFEAKQITAIAKKDVIEIVEYNLERHDMKKQAFKNMKTVLNQTFNYALKKELIQFTPMSQVPWEDYNDCFVASTPIKERGYTVDEMSEMLRLTQQNEIDNPADSRHWSYEFNLLTAMRRAEIPPLRWDDVHWEEGYIDVHQEEIGKKPYFIKPTTKTDKDRYFPITESVAEFLGRLQENNRIHHPESKFLFPDESQELGCISPNVTYRAHKRICQQLGITIDKNILRGTHAFRRVYLTQFIEGGGSIDLAANIYGNSDRTIKKHYLLGINSKASANIIDMTQKRINKQNKVNNSEQQKCI